MLRPFPQLEGLKLASLTPQKLYKQKGGEGANCAPDPEVLAISIIEVDNDGGTFANEVLSFRIDPAEYTGKKVLGVPRCCQLKKGTQGRGRINGLVAKRDSEIRRCSQR